MNNLVVDARELLENPSPRVPIVLCLDVSGSMSGEKINELNRGVREFVESLKKDEIASSSASLAVVTFSTGANLIQNFTTIERIVDAAHISTASGATYLGTGVQLALDTLDTQKALLKQVGTDYYQPWIVIMTDGEPCGESDSEWQQAAKRCRQLESQKKLVIFPIGIGPDANLQVLGNFSERPALRLKGLCFSEFFQWLSQSVVRVSVSRPGSPITLPGGIDKWAQI